MYLYASFVITESEEGITLKLLILETQLENALFKLINTIADFIYTQTDNVV